MLAATQYPHTIDPTHAPDDDGLHRFAARKGAAAEGKQPGSRRRRSLRENSQAGVRRSLPCPVDLVKGSSAVASVSKARQPQANRKGGRRQSANMKSCGCCAAWRSPLASKSRACYRDMQRPNRPYSCELSPHPYRCRMACNAAAREFWSERATPTQSSPRSRSPKKGTENDASLCRDIGN